MDSNMPANTWFVGLNTAAGLAECTAHARSLLAAQGSSGLTNHDEVVYAEGDRLDQNTGRQAPLLLLHLQTWQQLSKCSAPLM